jgi:hypothetical protein
MYSFRNSKSGMANDALLPYNSELTQYITQRGDYIIDSFEKLTEIVNLAFDNPNLKATAYFGIINTDALGKIKNSVPNLPKESKKTLFKPGRDYSVANTLDSIRHIVDEKALNREDVINYLDRLADTILEFDTVTFSFYIKGKEKLPGLLFKKRFSDGTLVSFNLISHKKRSLNLQTLYMDGADYQKKRNAETMLMRKAHSNTSKTLVGQTSDNIIPQTPEKVNTPEEKNKKYSDRRVNQDREILARVIGEHLRSCEIAFCTQKNCSHQKISSFCIFMKIEFCGIIICKAFFKIKYRSKPHDKTGFKKYRYHRTR